MSNGWLSVLITLVLFIVVGFFIYGLVTNNLYILIGYGIVMLFSVTAIAIYNILEDNT